MKNILRIATVVTAITAMTMFAQAETRIRIGVNAPPFYAELQPYGRWVELDAYGWAWSPNAVRREVKWRPYCTNGRWVQCDGNWQWQSGYAWGSIVFHHGRWLLASHHGWVWVPDTEWAPAWVTWRSDGAYCGWAPMPPVPRSCGRLSVGVSREHFRLDLSFGLSEQHFVFVPHRRFTSTRIENWVTTPYNSRCVFRQSRPVHAYQPPTAHLPRPPRLPQQLPPVVYAPAPPVVSLPAPLPVVVSRPPRGRRSGSVLSSTPRVTGPATGSHRTGIPAPSRPPVVSQHPLTPSQQHLLDLAKSKQRK